MPFVLNFCHVFYNGWTISTPNFSPKASSNQYQLSLFFLFFFYLVEFSQTSLTGSDPVSQVFILTLKLLPLVVLVVWVPPIAMVTMGPSGTVCLREVEAAELNGRSGI